LKKLRTVLLSLLLLCMLVSASFANNGDVVILFTNDVHSHVDTNIGYSGAAAMKQKLQTEGGSVLLVDSGDILQGDVLCTLSKGEIPVKLFDMVGYDFYTLGNHEFDYGVERLSELLDMTKTECVNCNIVYCGEGEKPEFLTKIKPYAIKQAGNKKIAFIGVTTPNCLESVMPGTFAEQGKNVYSFFGGHSASDEGLAKAVQPIINECKRQGADYVIVLSHLGDAENLHTSRALIKNSYNVDVVLDGHDHHVISGEICKNKDNKNVLLCSTGCYFANIGKITITADGKISSELISAYPKKDAKIVFATEKARKQADEMLSKQIGYTDFALPITSKSGARLVRCRETGIGNLCADVWANAMDTQIAFMNGGSLRAAIAHGVVCQRDILNMLPFENKLYVIEIKGSDLLDVLELSCSQIQKESEKGGKAIGEFGGFLPVHGLQFTVDSLILSPVVYDEKRGDVSINGKRRVSDVWLTDCDGRKIEQIMPEKTYSAAMCDYLAEGGNGYSMLKKYKPVKQSTKTDYEIMCDAIKNTFGGKIPKRYKGAEGRIEIK